MEDWSAAHPERALPDIRDSLKELQPSISAGAPSPYAWAVASLDVVKHIRSCCSQCGVARSMYAHA